MSAAVKIEHLPYLQSNPDWAKIDIWDSETVERIACEDLKYTKKKARKHLSGGTKFEDQGCQLCCIAMVLEILDEKKKAAWTPRNVYEAACKDLYLSRAGLSLVPLYADLCVDLTSGRVQLCAKENYAPNQKELPAQRLDEILLIRAYRALKPEQRDNYIVMIRIGCHDETVASHYLLIDPKDAGSPNSKDVDVLDPDMSPENRDKQWTFMDASKNFFEGDPNRKKLLNKEKVKPGNIAAVYVFARWSSSTSPTLLEALAEQIVIQSRKRKG